MNTDIQEIGVLLRQTRETKHLSLDQASRETNIAQRYLEALESANYEIFPGEPYVLGFLKNYCEYLELDTDQCIRLYKQEKLQEDVSPPENLIPTQPFYAPKKRGKKLLLYVGGFFLGIAICALLYFSALFVYDIFKMRFFNSEEKTPSVTTERPAQTYQFDAEEMEQRVFKKDRIIVPLNGVEHEIVVQKTVPELEISTALGKQIIRLGESASLDFDADTKPDVIISVEDLDARDNADKNTPALIKISPNTANYSEGQSVFSDTGNIAQNQQKTNGTRVLLESPSPYPVVLNASFRSYCLLRYEADRTKREEHYFKRGEQLTVQAKNSIRIWASNGNAVKMQVVVAGKTIDLEGSRPGEVIVKDLKWLKDEETGKFRFVVADVE